MLPNTPCTRSYKVLFCYSNVNQLLKTFWKWWEPMTSLKILDSSMRLANRSNNHPDLNWSKQFNKDYEMFRIPICVAWMNHWKLCHEIFKVFLQKYCVFQSFHEQFSNFFCMKCSKIINQYDRGKTKPLAISEWIVQFFLQEVGVIVKKHNTQRMCIKEAPNVF